LAENSTGSFLTSPAPGQNPKDLLAALANAYSQPLSSDVLKFLEFARNYLKLHRPAEIFTIPDNVGIKLTNFEQVQVFPDRVGGSYGDGAMANPDSSVSINRQ
jgi:hypothetical protein